MIKSRQRHARGFAKRSNSEWLYVRGHSKSVVGRESGCQEIYASQRQRPLLVVAVPSSWFVVGYPVGAT
ncbi:MAG: hypothetical protein AUI63_08865 [Gemmatimonadetes bacterium 13_1_40CM_2_60_3]|nr:MAG: hypothetical protein AUI63_08865 [Gemmatimonadetes bacterium 13_1_40CM_2_60_3]